MELTQDKSDAKYQIQAYTDGCVTVNGQKYFESILISTDQLISPWGPSSIELLNENHFKELLQYHPELVLLGTGSKLAFPPASLYASLTAVNIGVEVMDNAAACRTYTLLIGDERGILAVILNF